MHALIGISRDWLLRDTFGGLERNRPRVQIGNRDGCAPVIVAPALDDSAKKKPEKV